MQSDKKRFMFERCSYIFLILCICGNIFSQRPYKTRSEKAIKKYKEGLQMYQLQYYAEAEALLSEAIKTDENFQNAYLVLAEVYWEQSKYAPAIDNYTKGLAIDPSFYPQGFVKKAKLEMKTGQYHNALSSYQNYIKLDTLIDDYLEQAKYGIRQCRFAIDAIAHPVEFKPINLGPSVNTTDDEYWPSISADDKTLVITRLVKKADMMGGVQEDMFYGTRTDTGWSRMKAFGYPLNTYDNEGAQSITADGKYMVYTVCNRSGVIGRCDLYFSKKEGDDWLYPENMGAPVNTVSKETQPGIGADGREIYFACDRPGGKGGLDLWMSRRDSKGKWQEPVNLGDSVNTPGDEQSPFIHYDGSTLYFSSEGHLGMGGQDIYVARRDDKGEWSYVENIGYPINTYGDESGLIVDAKGRTAYYASNRIRENGKDIYKFDLPEKVRPQEVSYMKGQVFDEQSRRRLQANFELFDLSNGNIISKSISDERSGEFLLCIPANRNYMLNVERSGYLPYSDNFELKGIFHIEKPFLKDIPLTPIAVGGKVVLKNIFFETDSFKLRPESKYELDKIVLFLETNKNVKIEISGHTDNIGTAEYNSVLSEKRAKSVVDYLISKNIVKTRLIFKGYGLTMPVQSNDTAGGRAMNRRTELKVIE